MPRAALLPLAAAALLCAALACPPAGAQDASLDDLIARAKKRDAVAEYALGMMAYEGRGVPRNPSQALRLVERAAQRGHLDAMNAAGFFLQHGVGAEPDPARAREWYQVAADRGHAQAQVNLGWMQQQGLGGPRDAAAALAWYRKAAAQGRLEGEMNAAALLEAGAEGLAPDLPAAAESYARIAAAGTPAAESARASYRLGRLLEERRVPARTDGSTLERYLAAARAGLPEAQYDAGRLLLAANKGPEARAAIDWLEKAAQQRHAPAQKLLDDAETQYKLATLLDPAGAIPWLRKAAAQNHPKARMALALALEDGRGTARNPAEAAQWYQKSAEADEAEAHFRLGLMYDQGRGVPADSVRSRDHIARAAALGHDGAQEQMGRMLGGSFGAPNFGDPFKGLR